MRIKIHHADSWDVFLLANPSESIFDVAERARYIGAELAFHPREHRLILIDINSRHSERHGNGSRQHVPRHWNRNDHRGPFPEVVA